MELAVFCLFCGIATGVLATTKHRSAWKWFLSGLLLGPFALLAIGFMPKLEAPESKAPQE